MDLNLNKLPWYGQVGLFVALALAGVGVFYQFYVVPTTADMDGRRQQITQLRADITKGSTTANQLNQFKAQVAELEARLEGLKAVLPEQKDVADLLRRIQTLAVQSNLTIRGFKPSASVTKQLHAEWPIALQLDGTYHNLGDVLRSRQQVLANHQHQQRRHQGEGQARTELDDFGRLRGDDVRAAGTETGTASHASRAAREDELERKSGK